MMDGPVWDKYSAIPPCRFPNRHVEATGNTFSKGRAQRRHEAEKPRSDAHLGAVKTKAS